MLRAYQNAWRWHPDQEAPNQLFVISAGLCILLIPIGLSLGFYNQDFAIYTGVALAGLIGLTFVFSVRSYFIFVLPLALVYHHVYVQVAAIILFALSYSAEMLHNNDVKIRIPHFLLLSIIIVTGIIGVYNAVDTGRARFMFQFVIIAPMIVFMILMNLKPGLKEMKAFILTVSTLGATFGWLSLIFWVQTGISRNVMGWVLSTQNQAACFFGILLPLALVALLDAEELFERVIRGLIFTGLLAGILTSQTRAILLSSIVAMGYISFHDKRAMRIMLPVLLVAIIALPTLILTRFSMLFGGGAEVDWSTVGRIQIWLSSLEFIPDYWLFGMGIESFRFLYPANFPISVVRAEHPHNIYLRWLFEQGIFGLTAYIILIFGTLWRAHKAISKKFNSTLREHSRLLMAINASITALLVAGLVDAYMTDRRVLIVIWTLFAFQILLTHQITTHSEIDE